MENKFKGTTIQIKNAENGGKDSRIPEQEV